MSQPCAAKPARSSDVAAPKPIEPRPITPGVTARTRSSSRLLPPAPAPLWRLGLGQQSRRGGFARFGGCGGRDAPLPSPATTTGGTRRMAVVTIRDLRKSFGTVEVLHGVSIDIAGGRVRRARRPLRLRQVDAAAHARRARARHLGRDRDRRPGGERPAAQGSRHRDGVPELRALPAPDGRRQHGLLADAEERAEGRDRGAGRARRPRSSGSPTCSTAIRASSRAASASGWRWAAPSCATRRSSCSTSRCRTSTPSCASRCAPRSRTCTSG